MDRKKKKYIKIHFERAQLNVCNVLLPIAKLRQDISFVPNIGAIELHNKEQKEEEK